MSENLCLLVAGCFKNIEEIPYPLAAPQALPLQDAAEFSPRGPFTVPVSCVCSDPTLLAKLSEITWLHNSVNPTTDPCPPLPALYTLLFLFPALPYELPEHCKLPAIDCPE